MRSKLLLLAIGVLVSVVALGAIACGDDDDDANGNGAGDPTEPANGDGAGAQVEVRLLEWDVSPTPDTVAAGTITFNASNIGGAAHEFVVVATELDAAALPTADDGSVDESGEGISVLGEIEDIDVSQDGSLDLDLDAGSYVLLCNIVEDDGTSHYEQGMRTAFTVTS